MIRSSTYAPRLGDTAAYAVSTGAQVVGAGLSTVAAASSAGLLTLSATVAAAIPIAGAVIGVGILLFSLFHNSRGLQQDAETTAVVNKAVVYLQQNLAAWNASTKNYATQAQALKNFDDTWNQILDFCGNPNEGSPGERCISERVRGGIYDMFTPLRDPIANDPAAGGPDRAAAIAAEQLARVDHLSPAASSGAAIGTWVIPAALLLLAVVSSDK